LAETIAPQSERGTRPLTNIPLPQDPDRPSGVPGRLAEPPVSAAVAVTFPPAEARAPRTPEEAQRLAWQVIGAAFGVWLLLVGGGIYGLSVWFDTATVPAPARLYIPQGLVLFQERGASPLLSARNARDGMAMQEGDLLEVQDNTIARLELPGHGRLHLGPGARLVLATLRAGRFNPAAGALAFQHLAGSVRVEVEANAPVPLALETPYGTVTMWAGDYVVAVQGLQARALVRAGTAKVSVGAQELVLAAGERAELAWNAPAAGPFRGAANLLVNGDFAAGLDGWEPRDTQEPNRPDRPGQRTVVVEPIDGVLRPALRVARTSQFQTHNETGVMQVLNADVAVYPRLLLSGRVKVRAASLSGGGYLGTEYPLMLRLRYRDAAGNGQTWYRGFYYQNPERRPTDRGELVPRDVWVSFQFDLAQLPERPVFLYALEVLGAGHDFEALVTDLALVAE